MTSLNWSTTPRLIHISHLRAFLPRHSVESSRQSLAESLVQVREVSIPLRSIASSAQWWTKRKFAERYLSSNPSTMKTWSSTWQP
ncbi:hypothetical protein V5799_018140 [Amblyomma americanum]|uniref:Uncharacterized protein n=1 Tax=Amblyomma americanum TaxID=6943 RepID=A0AAQ4F194_AMBAM